MLQTFCNRQGINYGNVIQTTNFISTSKNANSIYTYTYEEFDKKGNWTKRIVKGKDEKYGSKYKEQHYINYRTITYYD